MERGHVGRRAARRVGRRRAQTLFGVAALRPRAGQQRSVDEVPRSDRRNDNGANRQLEEAGGGGAASSEPRRRRRRGSSGVGVSPLAASIGRVGLGFP